MRRTIIITVIVAAAITLAMFIINRVASGSRSENIYAEARRGIFEITVSNSGQLYAENSTDILGPEIVTAQSFMGGGWGGSGRMRLSEFKIQDIVNEGTIVKKGDYIAQLDRTEYTNSLRDAQDRLTTLRGNLEMKILDTAVSLTNLRDDIKNQKFVVEEALITLAQSKYEPPATIRQAEIALNKAERGLEQLRKNYELRRAQAISDIAQTRKAFHDGTELAEALEKFLQQFTIRAPSDGIVIYKTDWHGSKRKTGSTINPFDRVVATLPDLTTMISRTYVSEIEVSRVSTGQRVIITIDALPAKSFTGTIISLANIGEVLPNSDAKMFETLIRIDGTDMELRPAMTTWNRIIINTFTDVVYIPTECIHTGTDSITYVYTRNRHKQVVIAGEMNEKHIIIRDGLKPGEMVYTVLPEEPWKFRLTGQELLTRN